MELELETLVTFDSKGVWCWFSRQRTMLTGLAKFHENILELHLRAFVVRNIGGPQHNDEMFVNQTSM